MRCTESREQAKNNLLKITALLILYEVALDVELGFLVLGADFRNLTDPWMVEELRDRWPLVLVLIKTQLDEVLCIFGYVAPTPAAKSNFLITDILIDSVQILCVEWRLTAE